MDSHLSVAMAVIATIIGVRIADFVIILISMSVVNGLVA
jgi:hypothetical protein